RGDRMKARHVRFCPKADITSCTAHVRFWAKADMTIRGNSLSRSLLGVKRTCRCALHMSAFDPKRTFDLPQQEDFTRPLLPLGPMAMPRKGLRVLPSAAPTRGAPRIYVVKTNEWRGLVMLVSRKFWSALVILLAAAAVWSTPAVAQQQQKPNIVVIM